MHWSHTLRITPWLSPRVTSAMFESWAIYPEYKESPFVETRKDPVVVIREGSKDIYKHAYSDFILEIEM